MSSAGNGLARAAPIMQESRTKIVVDCILVDLLLTDNDGAAGKLLYRWIGGQEESPMQAYLQRDSHRGNLVT